MAGSGPAARRAMLSSGLVTPACMSEDSNEMVIFQRRSAYMLQQMTRWPQSGPVHQANTADALPPEVADVLRKVQKLLDEGQPAAALEQIGGSNLDSPWLANAAGVCQLRLGNANAAVETFRGLVLTGLFLREDAPTVFEVNFATALIADGNLSGGLRTLSEIREEGHPAVLEIRHAIRRWAAGM